MPLQLRPATREDIPLLRRWDEQPHVIASDPNDDWAWEENFSLDPPWREQFMAELDGRPIGFVQLIDPAEEESRYWGEVPPNLRALDIWIGEPDCLNQGYGTQMMQLALNRCFADPAVTAVLIDPLVSNEAAIRFYQRLGFEFVEYRDFGPDRCAVHELKRGRWEEKC